MLRGLRDPRPTAEYLFRCDAEYYGLYGMGRRGHRRRAPERLKAPPFLGVDEAAEHVTGLRSTWPMDARVRRRSSLGRTLPAAAAEAALLAFGQGFDDREKAALRALPELRRALWTAYRWLQLGHQGLVAGPRL